MKTFDKYEKRGAYHWDWYDTNKNRYKDLVHLVLAHLPTSGHVIDIGGGDGLISYLAFTNGLQVTCVDDNRYSIQLAKEQVNQVLYARSYLGRLQSIFRKVDNRMLNLRRRYEQGELQFIDKSIFDPSLDQPFDYAICHEVIEHIPQPQKLLDFITSNITNYAIISTPDVTDREPHELDYHNWTPETFSEFLSDYRFEFILRDGWNMYVKLYCGASNREPSK